MQISGDGLRRVIVGCWFTADGKVLPQTVRYRDDDGMIRTIDNIQLLSSDQFSVGVMSKKYVCQAEFNGVMCEFVLIFRPDKTVWDMFVRE